MLNNPCRLACLSSKLSGEPPLLLSRGPTLFFLETTITCPFNRSLDPQATVLVSEPAKIRREFALEHGATLVFDPTQDTIPIAVRKVVPPGVHVALDAAGVQASLDSCLLSLRPRGTYLNVALWKTTANVDLNLVLSKELNLTGKWLYGRAAVCVILTTMIGIIGYDHIHEEVLQLLEEGKFANIEGLITKKIKIDNVVEEGLKCLINEKDQQGQEFLHLS